VGQLDGEKVLEGVTYADPHESARTPRQCPARLRTLRVLLIVEPPRSDDVAVMALVVADDTPLAGGRVRSLARLGTVRRPQDGPPSSIAVDRGALLLPCVAYPLGTCPSRCLLGHWRPLFGLVPSCLWR
jgi:hypothetical protein